MKGYFHIMQNQKFRWSLCKASLSYSSAGSTEPSPWLVQPAHVLVSLNLLPVAGVLAMLHPGGAGPGGGEGGGEGARGVVRGSWPGGVEEVRGEGEAEGSLYTAASVGDRSAEGQAPVMVLGDGAGRS